MKDFLYLIANCLFFKYLYSAYLFIVIKKAPPVQKTIKRLLGGKIVLIKINQPNKNLITLLNDSEIISKYGLSLVLIGGILYNHPDTIKKKQSNFIKKIKTNNK